MERIGEVLNAFTVDVEDYFHVSAFTEVVARSEWESRESRVSANTGRILDLLDEFGVRGTFFVLGWVAEHHPDLVAAIARRGHELGAHSYEHRLIYRQDPVSFRDDLRRTGDAIERAAGVRPRVYRAPTFSITKDSLWALDILAEEGYVLDSSIFPVRHDRYGIPRFSRYPTGFSAPQLKDLKEFPMTTWRVLGANLPVAGGGYFRLFPLFVLNAGIRQANRAGAPAVFYLHPWELDPGQPRIRAPLLSRFRHYVGLKKAEGRLRRLLRAHRFGTISGALEAYLGKEAALRPERAVS